VRQGDLVGVAVVRFSCAFPRFLSPMSSVVRSEILSVREVGEVGSVLEVLEAVGEERPGRPGVVELVAASGLRGEHLARRPLPGRDLLDVDEAALVDAHEERVHSALCDVDEALLAEPRRDLVPESRVVDERLEDDALQGALEHLDLLPGHDDTSAFATQRRWVLVPSKAG